MLVLTRKNNESIQIGDDIFITVLDSRNGQVKLGVAAPPELGVWRSEIIKRMNDESRGNIK